MTIGLRLMTIGLRLMGRADCRNRLRCSMIGGIEDNALFLHNTLTGRVEPFVPLVDGHAGMYCCGPTVYLDQHLGNLRTYLFEDVLRRTLEDCGYRVRHVMNVTDVGHLTDDGDEGEDKMIKSARASGFSVEQIAEHYTGQFFRDCQALRITAPTVVCKATEHIPDMIALIERLAERGHTYRAGGNVFYDISTFPPYGRMARLDLNELQAGARIQVDVRKRSPHDFGLWFTNSKFERQAMLWDSPWGRGYPGWHIECSAMSMRYLGERFDIHCGGVDHIPVHHTNEIAQSDGATGQPCVRYWVHGEFLVIDGARMAKSGGNLATLSQLVERGFDPLDYRYFCLGAHYRDQHTFSERGMAAARSARRRLLDRIAELAELAAGAEPPGAEDLAEEAWRDFRRHARDDLHMPRCLAVLWGLVKDPRVGAAAKLDVLRRMDRILAVGIEEAGARRAELAPELRGLIERRSAARAERDFATADRIRAELATRGILLEDRPEGVRWRFIEGERSPKL